MLECEKNATSVSRTSVLFFFFSFFSFPACHCCSTIMHMYVCGELCHCK